MLDIADLNALRAYLKLDDTAELIPLPGGVSARTVLVRKAGVDTWVIKQALNKLAVQSDWFSDPARIHREADALRYLPTIAPPDAFTPLIFEDFETHLIAMQAVPSPHENLKTLFLEPTAPRERITQYCSRLGKLLAAIHRAPPDKRFDDTTFFETLRLEPYYLFAAQQLPPAKTFLHQLVASTRSRKLAIVHGDFSPKNVLVHNDDLVLLDHEVIHIGDPAFDIGFFLTHLLAKSIHVGDHFIAVAGSFIDAYAPPADIEPDAVRHTLACLLARVAGRSLLEYLTPTEREIQQRAALKIMQDPPARLHDVIEEFHQCTKSTS